MLNKFKVFSIEIRHKYYHHVANHYFDKANELVEMGDYVNADKCYGISAKYLEKQFALASELLEMA